MEFIRGMVFILSFHLWPYYCRPFFSFRVSRSTVVLPSSTYLVMVVYFEIASFSPFMGQSRRLFPYSHLLYDHFANLWLNSCLRSFITFTYELWNSPLSSVFFLPFLDSGALKSWIWRHLGNWLLVEVFTMCFSSSDCSVVRGQLVSGYLQD